MTATQNSDVGGFQKHPVLVICADTTIGLAVIRSLGRRGVPVYCAFSIKDALGPQSRFCLGSFQLPTEPKAAFEAIVENGRRWKVTHLIGISERHIAMLNSYRADLERDFTLLFPSQEVFQRATRKDATLSYASQAKVPAPRTHYPQRYDEIGNCRELRFPVVLKMARHEYPSGTSPAFQHKALIVNSFDELSTVLLALPEGQFPLVQEYVAGRGVGLSMLIRNRKAVLAFQHRRVREFPPDGGIGVLCEALPIDPALHKVTEALLAEMEWEGVAMVEYRGDWKTKQYSLMEVNGRFWGSIPTAIHAGSDFPYWLYRTSLPPPIEPDRSYRVHRRARSLAGDTKWLLATLKERWQSFPGAVLAYLGSFDFRTGYFIWSWDDPRPAVVNFLRRFIPG